MILIALLISVFSLTVFFGVFFGESGTRAEIYSCGELLGTYRLSKDEVIDVSGKNKIRIESGEVFMEYADCPDKICVKTGKIKNKGQQIVCLPNKLAVKVK